MRYLLLSMLLLYAAGPSFAQIDPRFNDPAVLSKQLLINSAGHHWTAGRTTVSDLTAEEFTKLLGGTLPKGYDSWYDKLPPFSADSKLDLPLTFDWRDSSIMTPVKNQTGCGSCWDFAANGAFEAALKKRLGIEYDLSEQAALTCNISGASCNGGWAEAVYELYTRYGAVLETCVPYQANDALPCQQGNCQVVAKAKGCQRVASDVNSIKQAILLGPVSSHFRVYQDFQSYYDGCYQHTYGNYIAGHVVVLVGWSDTLCNGEGAWLCKNSWGPGWAGLGGYFWIKWGDCNIGIGTTSRPLVADPVTLSYNSHHIDDASGDNDGVADAGESFLIPIVIRNTDLATATNAQAVLRSVTLGVTVVDSNGSFPDVGFNQQVESLSPHFAIALDAGMERGSRLDFTLFLSCDQGEFTCEFHDYVGHLDTVFVDDMEGGVGSWSHGGTLDDWQNGVPTGVGKSDPVAAHSGTRLWGNNLDGNYQAFADNYLESRAIDCTGLTKAKLRFWRFMAVEKGVYDSAQVLVNGNRLWINDSLFDAVDSRWSYHDMDISTYADNNAAVRIRFTLKSDDGLQMGGWHLDDVAVVGVRSYDLGDANSDGAIDISDAVFLISYIFTGGQTPNPLMRGDANCDGSVDISDAVYLIAYIFTGGPAPACS